MQFLGVQLSFARNIKSFQDLINKSYLNLLILYVQGSMFIANVGIQLSHDVASNSSGMEFLSARNFAGQVEGLFIPNNNSNLENLPAYIYRTFIGLRTKLLSTTFSERIS
jgi:hypothetical protein